MHVDQQDPGMAGGDGVHSSVVGVVVFQGFLFQVFCDVLDGCSVICFLIAEAHAVLFHGFLFPDEAFHIAEQAADLEVFAHIPAAVGPRNSLDDVRVPHFIVVFFELVFGNDDGALEFLRELVPVMRDMEDRKAGYGFEVLSGDCEEFLGRVEAAPGGYHGCADERFDPVNVRFAFQVQDKGTGVIRMDIRFLLQLFAEMESALLFQDADNFTPFLRRLKADAHDAVLLEVVFHFRFLLVLSLPAKRNAGDSCGR